MPHEVLDRTPEINQKINFYMERVLFVQKGQVKRLSLFDIEAKFKGNSLIYFFDAAAIAPSSCYKQRRHQRLRRAQQRQLRPASGLIPGVTSKFLFINWAHHYWYDKLKVLGQAWENASGVSILRYGLTIFFIILWTRNLTDDKHHPFKVKNLIRLSLSERNKKCD
jgi:hypothetical protein